MVIFAVPGYRVENGGGDTAMPSDWVTVSQAAEIKGVPDYVIRNAIRGGTLPVDRESGVLLIHISDLERWEPREKGRPRQKKRGRPPKQK